MLQRCLYSVQILLNPKLLKQDYRISMLISKPVVKVVQHNLD